MNISTKTSPFSSNYDRPDLCNSGGDLMNNSSLLATHLLDAVCPIAVSSDVDRAILAASIGG